MVPQPLGQGLRQVAARTRVRQHLVAARPLDRGGQGPRPGDLDLEHAVVPLRLLLEPVQVLGQQAAGAPVVDPGASVSRQPAGCRSAPMPLTTASARPVIDGRDAAAGHLGEVGQVRHLAEDDPDRLVEVALRRRPGATRSRWPASSARPGASPRWWPSRRPGCRRRPRPPGRGRCRTPGRAARPTPSSPSTETTARCSSPWARSWTVPPQQARRACRTSAAVRRRARRRRAARASRRGRCRRPARCRARTAACRPARAGRCAAPCAGRS